MKKEKEYIICDTCGMSIYKSNFRQHKTSCDKIKEQMPFILQEFDKRNHGIYKIACERHLNFPCLSRQFKKMGIDINIDKDGKYPRQYKVNDDYFDIMGWEQYWLLGLLASDGAITHDHYISLSQSGDEGLILIEYVNKILDNNVPIRHTKTKYKTAHQLYFSSPKIAKILKTYNIVPNKTYNYDFPNIPKEYIKPFLIGYILGDGCISFTESKNAKYFNISFVGTPNFIQHISCYLPFKATILLKGKNKTVMEWRVNGINALKFADWLFENWNGFTNYKYQNYLEYKKYFLNDSRESKYRNIKNEVLHTLQTNPTISIMEYAKQIKIPFQTIYCWKNKWKEEGLL